VVVPHRGTGRVLSANSDDVRNQQLHDLEQAQQPQRQDGAAVREEQRSEGIGHCVLLQTMRMLNSRRMSTSGRSR
jgi:hypothetical protein